MRQGIYKSVPMEKYLADPCETPSLTASLAQTILAQSPLHAKWQHPRMSPSYQSRQKDEFDLGIAAHSVILEGIDIVQVCDYPDWRKGAAQAEKEAARVVGKIPLLRKQYERVLEMVEVARNFMGDCELSEYLTFAEAENTCIWEYGGQMFRSRPDLMSTSRTVLVNYKTAESANPDAFIRGPMRALGYDLSASFYEWGMECLGHEAQEYFLVQETRPPYACSLVGLDPAMREIAAHKRELAVQIWLDCMKADKWPGYSTRVHYAAPSAGQMMQHEELKYTLEERITLGTQG